MSENDMSDLNKVYNEILGAGPDLEDEVGSGTGLSDGAYAEEDYSDEAGDGVDPRDDDLEDDDDREDDADGEEPANEDDDEQDDNDDDDDDDNDDDYEDIPERLIEAGRAANLPDEDIVELAENSPHVLEALARSQESARNRNSNTDVNRKPDTQEKPSTAKGFEPLKLEFDADDEEEMGPRALKVIETLVGKVNDLGSQLNEQSQGIGQIQQATQSERVRQIDQFFDEKAKDIPVLGNSSSLTEASIKNRKMAFAFAREAMRIDPSLRDDEALAMGANAIAGQMKEAQVKAKLVKDLKKNENRFIARGKSRRRKVGKKSVEDRAMEKINEVLDRDY